jgi:aryl-alcohol dehydrogenase-like predicted oxidoreductase
MSSRFALGTVQFGMDYGINNQRGKVPAAEVREILTYAHQNGVDTLDSAHSYGDSEKIIGEFVKSNGLSFKIVSKLAACKDTDVEKMVHESFERLQVESIDGYLVHDFKFFMANPAIWDVLCRLKSKGKIKKIGFSLYSPQELHVLWQKNIKLDIVQVPFSIFDQRFLPLLPLLQEKQTEVHVRSIFLQGLVFKNANDLKGKLLGIKEKLVSLAVLSDETNVPIAGVCINFALLNQHINKIVMGVDGIDNLKENLGMAQYQDAVKKIYPQLAGLAETNEDIILPFNWKNA